MTTLIHEDSHDCLKSELALFDLPPTQTSVEETRLEEFNPLTSLDRSGPVHFKVQVGDDSYIDPNEVYLYLKARILDGDGNPLTEKDSDGKINESSKVFPVNNFIGSCFRDVEVYLNNVPVGGNTGLYPYRSYLTSLLSYSREVKDTVLKCGMYSEDTGFMDCTEPESTDKTKSNSGANYRFNQTKYSKSFEAVGRISSELFDQKILLLSKIAMVVKLTRQDQNFVLMSKVATSKYRIVLDEAKLRVTVKKIAPHVREAHENRLLTTNAKYPMKRSQLLFFSRAGGISDLSEPNVVNGTLPTRMTIGLIETDAFNGHIQKNPFNFQHFDISQFSVRKNGQEIPFEPLFFNFSDGKNRQTVLGYFNMMQSLGFLNRNKSNGIDPHSMYASGYTLYSVNLTSDMTNTGSHFNLQQTGNLQLILKLRQSTTKAVTILTYLEFDSVLEIDKDRNVIYNE